MKNITLKGTIEVFDQPEELTAEDRELLELAERALEQAYAEYSHFQVGAALLLENGELITGSNVENASYPLALCAERVALAAAHSRFPGISVVKMAIRARSAQKAISQPIPPCGACRQVMAETEDRSGREMTLLLQGTEGPVYRIASCKLLLPLSFDRSYLTGKS